MKIVLIIMFVCLSASVSINIYLLTKPPLSIPVVRENIVQQNKVQQNKVPQNNTPSLDKNARLKKPQKRTAEVTQTLGSAQKDVEKASQDMPVEHGKDAESNHNAQMVAAVPLIEPDNADNTKSAEVLALEEQFRQESYDVNWAPQMEMETLDAFYANDLAHSDLDSVECREQLCKIMVHHDSRAAVSDFQYKLLAYAHDFNGGVFHQQADNGQWQTLIFRIREPH